MDPQTTFVKRFGDLVALLRSDPGNDAAQDLALTAAGAAILHGPVRLDVGIEGSALPEPLTLQARLLARQVDAILITPDVDLSELLALARALAHDTMPLPATSHIEVVPLPTGPPTSAGASDVPRAALSGSGTPVPRRMRTDRRASSDRRRGGPGRWAGPERRVSLDRRGTGERRLGLVKDVRAESVRLYSGLVQASGRGAWEETLYTVIGLARLAPRVPQIERRTFMIRVRRALQRSAIEAIIEYAERDPAVRTAATEVLLWLGLDAGEVMIDRLRSSPVLGPREFLLDGLSRMPGVYPMVASLLRSDQPHVIKHGAAIVARLGDPEAAALLLPHLQHANEEVRVAAVHALGCLHRAPIGDALRLALGQPSPVVRVAAAEAIVMWRGGTLGIVLSAALATEHNRTVWDALIDALGRIGTPAACATLTTIVRSPRSFLSRQGYSLDQRLAAVTAIARTDTPAAYRTLQALARDTDADVRARAQAALGASDRTQVAVS